MFETPCLILNVGLSAEELQDVLENVECYVSSGILIVQFHSESNQRNSLPKLSPLIRDIYSFCDKNLPFVEVQVNLSFLRTEEWLQIIPDGLLLAGISTSTRNRLIDYYKVSSVINLIEGSNCNFLDEICEEEMVEVTVLGGTFDRIHLGHKILLIAAVLRAKRRVVVGVTDEQMIKGKKIPELILPVHERIQHVENFLKSVDKTLKYEVVPIGDPFGPTATDPDMDLIVVSQETLRGGQKVNELRAKNGLKELKIHVIPLVDDSVVDSNRETKVSSSNQRFELLGTLQKAPYSNELPYLILLCGAAKSGKSTVAHFLEEMGAKVLQNLEGILSLQRSDIGIFDCEIENLNRMNEIWLCSVSSDAQKLRGGEGLENFRPEREPNVVLSSSYDLDCLKRQVEIAWENLKDRLADSN